MMASDYGTGTYRNNTFKMSITEGVRAHNEHDLATAANHYKAAVRGASNGYATFAEPLLFLQSQAESQACWSLADALKNAQAVGFEDELTHLGNLIDDPSIKQIYTEYLGAVRQGERPVTRRIARLGYVDPTPTSRTARPR